MRDQRSPPVHTHGGRHVRLDLYNWHIVHGRSLLIFPCPKHVK